MSPFSNDRGPSPRDGSFSRGAATMPPALAHRLALYQFVGENLSRPAGAPREVISAWIASALQEPSHELRSILGQPPNGPVVELLARLLLQLETRFSRTPSAVTREFSAYIESGDGPVRSVTQRSEHRWEDRPANGRAAFLGQQSPVEFRHWRSAGGR